MPPAPDRNSMRTPRLSPFDGAGYIRRAIMASLKRSVIKVCGGRHHMVLKIAVLIAVLGLVPESLSAQSKQEFKMSVVVAEDTAWGRAAKRFADALRHRTQARINVTNYFDGKLFADRQTTEFHLLQQGAADFAIGSTINWSPQVKELNLFALPFMFPSYRAVDTVQAGDPGRRLFQHIERKGVIPIAWGENGFRELTNGIRPIRRPEDLQGLKIRVVGIPILVEIFEALGAKPVRMNWGEAQIAIRQRTVDGQENPVALIIPYRIWSDHRYITQWRYAIDPLILAVSARTWATLAPEDRKIVSRVGEEIMAVQKREAREGLERGLVDTLQRIYGMEEVRLSPADIKAFRDKTRPVYARWADEIGVELVRNAEQVVESVK
jgi:TRAP-type transport system periplasmic protein